MMGNGVKRAIWYRPYLSLEAILTGRQPHEKLQCLYGNLMLNNFRKTAVLKKKLGIVNLSFAAKDCTAVETNFQGHTCAQFLWSFALDFSYISLQFFTGNFTREEKSFMHKCTENFIKGF